MAVIKLVDLMSLVPDYIPAGVYPATFLGASVPDEKPGYLRFSFAVEAEGKTVNKYVDRLVAEKSVTVRGESVTIKEASRFAKKVLDACGTSPESKPCRVVLNDPFITEVLPPDTDADSLDID